MLYLSHIIQELSDDNEADLRKLDINKDKFNINNTAHLK